MKNTQFESDMHHDDDEGNDEKVDRVSLTRTKPNKRSPLHYIIITHMMSEPSKQQKLNFDSFFCFPNFQAE